MDATTCRRLKASLRKRTHDPVLLADGIDARRFEQIYRQLFGFVLPKLHLRRLSLTGRYDAFGFVLPNYASASDTGPAIIARLYFVLGCCFRDRQAR